MATITGSQQAKTYALAGKMRAGNTRAGYTSPKVFVSIAGTQYATSRAVDANKVLDGTLSITDVLNQTPNTAALTMMGAEPAEGSDVVITLGSINNSDRLYAGTVLNRSHRYLGTPAFWQAPLNVIDYTWQLTRRRVSGSYTNTAPAVIAAAIVAAVPGFTVSVAAGLPTLDAFSYTDIDALAALTQLATRCGGYCDVDYHKVVKLFITDASITAPTALTPAHPSLTAFAWTRDLSQVRTRIYVEGGGVTSLAPCAVGETIIPVESTAWYSAAGGTVKSGPQHVTYAGVDVGARGSIVGPGVSPAAAPALALVAGTGLSLGVYQYAYTDVTASGESLPSPLAIVITTALAAPTTIGTAGSGIDYHGGLLVTTGSYSYKFTFYRASDSTETLPSPASNNFTPGANGTGRIVLSTCSTPPTGYVRRWYRTTDGGGTWKLVSVAQGVQDPVGSGILCMIDDASDASLGAPAPSASTAIYQQVAPSGIAIGPAGTTQRKVYRTVVNGSQLKLQQTIANNSATVGVTDATADGSLGANAPTSDTSALTQPTGQVLAGATSLLLAGAGVFSTSGGWALVGAQVIRYTGITGNTLTGIPASGVGSITATIAYNTTVTASPALIGIPATGVGAITYPILQGDQVNLLVQVDDLAAQAALATLMGGSDDGVVEDYVQDGTIGQTEALARGNAKLAQCSTVRISIAYDVRDKNSRAGRTVHVALTSPTSLTGDFMIQSVTIDTFSPALMPTFHVRASSDLVSLEDLLRMFRQRT